MPLPKVKEEGGIWVAIGTESYEESTLIDARTDKKELLKAVTAFIEKEKANKTNYGYLGFSEVEIWLVNGGETEQVHEVWATQWSEVVTPEGVITIL